MAGQPEQPVRLAPDQRTAAVQVMTRAFQDDPLYVQLIPDAQERTRCVNRLWDAIVRSSLIFGQVYTTPGLDGVACWLAPGHTDMNLWQMLRSGLALPRAMIRYRPETRQRMLAMVAQMDRARHELVSGRYWYLWFLGVDPRCQGQGIGGRLLEPVLRQADAAGLPCYLETETERNVAFYVRHGFRVAREENLARLRYKMWLMIREGIALS